MFKHSRDYLIIIEEGNHQGGHHNSAVCKQGAVLKRKQGVEEDTRKANEVVFTFNGVPVENVRRFVYPGRKLSSTDDNCPDV
jgi:hypothetical protein